MLLSRRLTSYRHRRRPTDEWYEETPQSFSCEALYLALELSNASRGLVGHLLSDHEVDEYLDQGTHTCKNSWFCGLCMSPKPAASGSQLTRPTTGRDAELAVEGATVTDFPPPFPGAHVGWVTEQFTFAEPEGDFPTRCTSCTRR